MRFLLPLLLASPLVHLVAEEWWGWSTLEWWRSERVTASMFLGNRFDFEDGATVQIVSPRLRYEISTWLDAGLGASLLSLESPGTGHRHLQGRPELELNPHWQLTPRLRFDWRNRLEFRWNEGEAATFHRSRQRWQLAYALPRWAGPLTRVFVSNEWLMDLHGNGWNENRLVPAGLSLRIHPRAELDLFYLLLSSRPLAGCQAESVLGTHFRYRL